jgi:hypothetical protein
MNVFRQNVALDKFYTNNDEWPGSRPCRFKPIGIKIVNQINHEPKEDGGRKHYYINQESSNEISYKPTKKIFNERYSPENNNDKKSGVRKIIPTKAEPNIYYSRVIANPYKIREHRYLDNRINDYNSISLRNGYQVINSKVAHRNGNINSLKRNIFNSVDYSMNNMYGDVNKSKGQSISIQFDKQYVSRLDNFDKQYNYK